MGDLYIKRRLKIGEEYFSEEEALEQGTVLVVLAEPGAGKSDLLKNFGNTFGVVPIRASRFLHQTQVPGNTPLIIDALDELAKIDQSSIDQVIVKAQETGNGRVIFATRSSEWQGARTKWIHECFGTEPTIVWIEPFTQEEQKLLFEDHLPEEDFAAFAVETDRFELSPLLGNPQFLRLFADAYIQSGRRFNSKAQIFLDAVERLAFESADRIASAPRPPSADLVRIAGEVMAKLLLAGASGVSAKEDLADIDYPYLAAMAANDVIPAYRALDTRLFKPGTDADQHEPVHRIVAEYCAAQFLVRRITDRANPVSLRRVLSLVAPNGAVRDELRGLLGWMAAMGNECIERAAIELDAYAVIANGDPSQLVAASKKLLLQKLAAAAEVNPGFRRSDYWRRFSVGGFFTNDLVPDVRQMLQGTPATSPLTDLLLELLVNSGGPTALVTDVRSVLFNRAADEHTRIWAGRAIPKLAGTIERYDLDALILEATPIALRVATHLFNSMGLTAQISTRSRDC